MSDIRVRAEAGDITRVKTDLVVVNLFQGVKTPGGATGAVDAATGGAISAFLKHGDFEGKLKETAVLYPEGLGAPRVLLVGLGKQEDFDLHRVREVAARVAKRARDLGVAKFATIVHGAGIGGLDAQIAAEAVAEASLLATYTFTQYKGKGSEDEKKKHKLKEMTLLEADSAKLPAVRKGVASGTVLAESVNLTRDLAVLSGEEAWPAKYGDAARKLARETGLKVQVFDKKKIQSLKMGGLLAVNQGSVREPRFIVLEHKPARATGRPFVLVGKGITFDTGGISIKPSDKMEDMKFDKSGACAVLGIMRAVALLKLPVHVVGLTAWTDNMPSGSAYKPGDIVTAMNGKTIEVVNTDAEGRVILSDALSYASRYDPAGVVEMSTLTGAVVIALGNQASGAFGNNAKLIDALKASAEATHERVWEMPMFSEYGEMVKSKVADVKNSAGRSASSCTAAKFLENFVDGYPWVHLDIAGTAWCEGSPGYNEEFNPGPATGVGVRLLTHLLRNWDGRPFGESKSPKRAKPAKAKATKRARKARA